MMFIKQYLEYDVHKNSYHLSLEAVCQPVQDFEEKF